MRRHDGAVRTRRSSGKPVSHTTLLNHYEWASSRNHGRQMRKVREENETLKLTLRIKQAIGVLLLAPLLAFGQAVTPPPPMPMSAQLRLLSQHLGKEANHFVMPVSVLVTQTVTTVYRLKFLRVIEVTADATNASMETNFLSLNRTSIVSCVTNTSPTP